MRSVIIDQRHANRRLVEVLRSAFRLRGKAALEALRQRQVRICGGVCLDPERRVKVGQHIQLDARPSPEKKRETRKSNAGGDQPLARDIVVRHVDEHVIVVEKPAGLTTVRHADEVASLGPRARKFLPPTLVDLLPGVLARAGKAGKGRIRAVHRIDKETSGLVVLARTGEAESALGKQFRAHSIGRRYLALVRGTAQDARIETHFVPDRGDGRRGSSATSEGQHAVTHVRLKERLGDFSLVECELETGRTHQVRIHLGETGTPLCGEKVYDRPLHGKPIPDASGAKRPLLHAVFLAFDHPATGKRLEWTAEMPADMHEIRSTIARSCGR